MNVVEDFGAESTVKDVGLESTMDSLQSPSRWPQEFEKKQQEIIELWHDCNVSLVHRTYFYMLFKGDPTDSIYMEVELRRLSFLKSNLSLGNADKTAELGQSSTYASRFYLSLCYSFLILFSCEHRRNLLLTQFISCLTV